MGLFDKIFGRGSERSNKMAASEYWDKWSAVDSMDALSSAQNIGGDYVHSYVRPVSDEFGISSSFGTRTLDGDERHHGGIDYLTPIGTPFGAMAAGEVIRTEGRPSLGELVAVKHEDGNISVYAHLEKVYVEVGQKVDRGEILGLTGDSGSASRGPHLHVSILPDGMDLPETGSFGYTLTDEGIDPAPFLPDDPSDPVNGSSSPVPFLSTKTDPGSSEAPKDTSGKQAGSDEKPNEGPKDLSDPEPEPGNGPSRAPAIEPSNAPNHNPSDGGSVGDGFGGGGGDSWFRDHGGSSGDW